MFSKIIFLTLKQSFFKVEDKIEMGEELPERIFFFCTKTASIKHFLLALSTHASLKLSGEKRWTSEGLNDIRIKFLLNKYNRQFFLI